MQTNTAHHNQCQQISSTFSKIPNWLQQRTEISHLAKIVYARLGQCANASKEGLAYPSRAFLAQEIGCSIRTLSRGLRELKQHNLIVVVERGCNMPTVYRLTEHIWMLQAKTYLKPAVNMDGPNVSRPHYIYKQITKNKQKGFRKEKIEYSEQFEEWWSEYPRQVDKVGTYHAFMKALEKTDYNTLRRKSWSYRDQAMQKTTKEWFIGSKRWLEDEMWKLDYCQFEWKMATDKSLLPKLTTFPCGHFVEDRAGWSDAQIGFTEIRKALAA